MRITYAPASFSPSTCTAAALNFAMAADETTQKWWSVVVPMLEAVDQETASAGVWADMEEIFHLE